MRIGRIKAMSDGISDEMKSSGAEGKSEVPTLRDEVQGLLKEVRSQGRRYSRVKNLLKDVARKEPDAGDYEEWLEVHQGLTGYELAAPQIEEKRERVVARLGSELKRLRVKARMKFMTKLEMLAGREEVEVERISEAPLVLYLKPLTLEVDFEGGGARLLFGHEPIEEVAIDAERVLDGRRKILERLRKESVESEEFFDRLLKAYRTVLVADGAEFGARVDLVDVAVPLAMLRAGAKELRKKGTGALRPYSRELLAWQLARLRRDGMLEKGGLRVDLGAATGGSTKDKADVLYIPVGAKSGQYYGSLKFEKVG